MKERTVNYTSEMVARLHEVYDGGDNEDARVGAVDKLSKELNRSPASIRAKLTREGVYVPKAKVEKGKAGPTKAVLVTAIAKLLEVPEDVVGSLEKANKNTLARILVALRS